MHTFTLTLTCYVNDDFFFSALCDSVILLSSQISQGQDRAGLQSISESRSHKLKYQTLYCRCVFRGFDSHQFQTTLFRGITDESFIVKCVSD